MSNLESFIKQYLNNKRISESKSGYAAWLRRRGIDPTLAESQKISDTDVEEKRAEFGIGSKSSDLRNAGIASSGYSRFLSDSIQKESLDKKKKSYSAIMAQKLQNQKEFTDQSIADEREAEAKEKAKIALEEKRRKEAEEAAKKAAEENAAKSESEKKRLNTTIRTRLEDAAIINYDDAYQYAIEMGAAEEDAKMLAGTTTKIAREKAQSSVIKAIVNKRYTKNQAMEYALSLGLSPDDAEALAEIAFKTNESTENITSYDDYLKYLENKIKNSN